MGYSYYNPNPAHKSVGDCTVRALSKALGQSWGETYAGLALEGYRLGDMPNADSVWGPYLRKRGFARHILPDSCLDGTCCVFRTGIGATVGTAAGIFLRRLFYLKGLI